MATMSPFCLLEQSQSWPPFRIVRCYPLQLLACRSFRALRILLIDIHGEGNASVVSPAWLRQLVRRMQCHRHLIPSKTWSSSRGFCQRLNQCFLAALSHKTTSLYGELGLDSMSFKLICICISWLSVEFVSLAQMNQAGDDYHENPPPHVGLLLETPVIAWDAFAQYWPHLLPGWMAFLEMSKTTLMI